MQQPPHILLQQAVHQNCRQACSVNVQVCCVSSSFSDPNSAVQAGESGISHCLSEVMHSTVELLGKYTCD